MLHMLAYAQQGGWGGGPDNVLDDFKTGSTEQNDIDMLHHPFICQLLQRLKILDDPSQPPTKISLPRLFTFVVVCGAKPAEPSLLELNK